MPDSNGDDRDFAVVSKPYEITLDDYRAMMNTRPKRNRIRYALIWFAALFNIGVSVWLVLTSYGPWFEAPLINYINGLLGIALLLFSFVVPPLIVRRYYRMIGYAGRQHVFEGGKTIFKIARDGLKSELTWDGLLSFSDTSDHFFFWINRAQAVILPKRALEREADQTVLRQFLSDAEVKDT